MESKLFNLNSSFLQFFILLVAASLIGVLLFFAVSKPGRVEVFNAVTTDQVAKATEILSTHGIDYSVNGFSVLVKTDSAAQATILLSMQGVRSNEPLGYGHLDNLTKYGVSATAFNVAYWRAKEEELEKTLLSSGDLKEARVHLSYQVSPSRKAEVSSASIFAEPYNGVISRASSNSFRRIVASAVPGLSFENVFLVDGSSENEGFGGGGSSNKQSVEFSNEIKGRIERLLVNAFPNGLFQVEVDAEVDFLTQNRSEKIVDPESRSVVSQESVLSTNDESAGSDGEVTIASNLPQDASSGPAVSSSKKRSENLQLSQFEYSRRFLDSSIQTLEVQRISIAVLIDDGVFSNFNDATRSSQLDSLERAISAAAGLQLERGDILVVEALAFGDHSTSEIDEFKTSWLPWLDLNPNDFIRFGLFATSLLFVYLFVIRSMLQVGSKVVESELGEVSFPPIVPDGAAPINNETDIVLAEDSFQSPIAEVDFNTLTNFDGATNGISTDGGISMENSIDNLKDSLGARQSDAIEIVRDWMSK